MMKSASLLLLAACFQLLPSLSNAQICTNIQAIQGTGAESIRLGDIVKVCGATVTSTQFNGFTMQMPPADPNYPASSAMFVRSFNNPLVVGDLVNVEGTVFEFTGRTVLDRAYITKRGASRDSFGYVDITLPVNSVADYQRYESMQVRVTAKANHDIVIADYEEFDYTDSIGVCSVDKTEGRPYQFTSDHAPSTSGFAAHNAMLVNSCIHVIGDTRDFLFRIGTFENRIRGGSKVTILQGTLGITVNADRWEIAPAADENFQYSTTANPRSDPPAMNGADVIVVSSNLGTYNIEENGDEFDRQVAKLIPGLVEMNADIYAVQGIVTGSPGGKDIASRLNTETNGRSYKGVKAESPNIVSLGNGATRVDIIYDSNKLTFLSSAYLDDTSLVDTSLLQESTIGTIFNQPYRGSSFPLIASFSDRDGNLITVVSTQFITRKFSDFLFEIIGTPDRDIFDGAGDFNLLRTIQAQALVDWVNSHPTGISNGAVVMAGSLNAFAAEDPIGAIESGGFKSLTGQNAYNYGDSQGFGSTDYIFVRNSGANANDEGRFWHVNADEIPIISYRNCVAAGFCRDDPTLFDSSVPARYARRDPLVAGIHFNDGGGGTVFCFSGTTVVETKNHGLRLMRDLSIGDEILVDAAKEVYEPVYSFGHYNTDMKGDFLQFQPSGLEISPDHMVFLDGKAVPAAMVQVGDVLSGNAVTSIKAVTRQGVFAPFTPSGKLIVNGVDVSSYVAFENNDSGLLVLGNTIQTPFTYQWLAHTFQFPQRVACYYFGNTCTEEQYDESGVSTWVATPLKVWQWILLECDNLVITTIVAVLYACIASIFYFLENYYFVTLMAAAGVLVASGSSQRIRFVPATKQC